MVFSETIEGAVASLFFFDEAAESNIVDQTEDNSYNYGHCGWYVALGVCLFLGMKVVFKRYFPGKKRSRMKIVSKKTYLWERLTNILRRAFGMSVEETNSVNSKYHMDPLRSIQLPRIIRKSLQEKLQIKVSSSLMTCTVDENMQSPKKITNSIAEVSRMSEQSTRYQDAVSIGEQSLKRQNLQKETSKTIPKMSPKIPQESPVRRYTSEPQQLADVVRSLVPERDSKLTPHISQKLRCQQLQGTQTQGTNSILLQEEQVLDCNSRCPGDPQHDRKCSLYLTYPNIVAVRQKPRSMFSRSKLGRECMSHEKASDDLRFADDTSCYIVNHVPEKERNTTLDTPDTLKATPNIDERTSGSLRKGADHLHGISQTDSPGLTKRSGVKKKSVIHFSDVKERGGENVADVNTPGKCIDKAHKAVTAPAMKNEDLRDGSSPACRKWQKLDKYGLKAADLSYKSCPGNLPLVLEIFDPRVIQGLATGKIGRQYQISEANFENRHALKRNKRISVAKDEHNGPVSVDTLEIVAIQMQPMDLRDSRSSKTSSAGKRKRMYSSIQKNAMELDTKERHRSLLGKRDTRSGSKKTDLSLSVKEQMVLHGTKENQIRPSLIEHQVRPTVTELNLATNEHGKHPNISSKCGQEMPQTSKHKTSTGKLPLFDRRPESIRMVESLLSVTGAHATDSSTTLAVRDSSISRALVSKKGKSIAYSLTAADARERLSMQTAVSPEHVKIDLMKMPGGIPNKNKKAVKKSIRFAVETERYEAGNPVADATQISPSAWSRSRKILTSSSVKTADGKLDKKSNTTHQKRAKSFHDYPTLFDKFVLQNKDDIQNALLLCQSAESAMCEKMYLTEPQSPGSVRIRKIRSRTTRYPTLMSFLDHIEKKNNRKNSLKDIERIHLKDMMETAIKHRVGADFQSVEINRADTDAAVTPGVDLTTATSFGGSDFGSGIREVTTEGIQKGSVSGSTCQNVTTLSDQQHTQKHNTNLGLHFGTDNLQLYSESADSICFPKKDNKSITDAKVVLPRQGRTGGFGKKQSVMKHEQASKTEHLQKLKRVKIEAKAHVAPKGRDKTELKMLGRNSLRTIKESVNKKTSIRENNIPHKVAPSELNSRKADTERASLNKRQQCTKHGVWSSVVQLKSKTKHGLAQSLFAVPDPTRGSENIAETELLEAGSGDSPKVSDAQMVINECRTEELSNAPALVVAGNIDTFKDIISLEQNQLKSPMSVKSMQLSSPSRSRCIELPSPCRVRGVVEVSRSPAKLGTTLNEIKSMYPCSKIPSPVARLPLELSSENVKNTALHLQMDKTPPRIRKRIRRLKTCSLGHVMTKLSEAESKPPRGDASRDTDLSSTSKSLASTDIHATRTTRSARVIDTSDKMPVIVQKLLIDSTKRQSNTFQVTSCSEKHHSPQEKSASPVQKLLPTSFSRSQPLQSIRRGSLKDIFDRYVVHTSEYPQRHGARITSKFVKHARTVESGLHSSLIDQDVSARSPIATSYQLKPEVSQRNISSYTSKYRANDNIDKSVKSPWRGTVAFRKRLQHLLQHNKHIQNKYRHINMAAKKTSSVDISPSKLNSLPANKDKLGNIYKVSRIVRPGHGVLSQISEIKHDTLLDSSKPDKAKNIHSTRKVVTPVSKLLDVRVDSVNIIVDSKDTDAIVHSAKSPLHDKTTDEENNILTLNTSPTASDNPLDTLALSSSKTVTISPKCVKTHSDHFEQKIQYQFKRQKEEMEHKLIQIQGNLETNPLTNVANVGSPTKSSATCSVFNRRVLSRRPRVAWLQKQAWKVKGKQLDTTPCVTELAPASQRTKPDAQVTDSPQPTITPASQHQSNSEGPAAETVTAKVRSTVRVVGLETNDSLDCSDIRTEVTRCDFFTPNDAQPQPADDTRFQGTIKKEMTRVSETEHNLQLLLDKIKQRSFLTSTTSNDEDKENVKAPVIKEKLDITTNLMKATKFNLKLGKKQQSVERLSRSLPLIENGREITEQTKSNFLTDKKPVAGVTSAASQSFPASLCESPCRIEKESTRSHKLGVDIKRLYDGNKKTDQHAATKAVAKAEFTVTNSKTEFTVTNRKTSMVTDKDHHKFGILENTNKDEKARLSARRMMHIKYKLTPRNKVKRTTSSYDKKTNAANESSTTPGPSVKHVAFKLNDQDDKSCMETITSEVAAQESSETYSTDLRTEVNESNTEMPYSHGAKIAHLYNKVRQTISVLNILSTDEGERVDKNAPRKDMQMDQISDTSHTFDKQQSTTEATGKLPCSSGYGTMDILSTTSFSQLQNSSTVEPGKLTAEPLKAREECVPGSQIDTLDNTDDPVLLHVCKHSEICHENSEPVAQASSLTTSFWKKEMHMDVIPEEADYENGVDPNTSIDSAKGKLSEPEMKKSAVEDTYLETIAVKECVAGSVVTDKSSFDTAVNTDMDDINKEQDTLYLDTREVGQKNKDNQVVNIPVPTQEFDESCMEMSGDMESPLQRYLNKQNYITDTRKTHEMSERAAEDTVWNHPDIANGYSPPSDTCIPDQVDRDSLRSPQLDQAVAETVSHIVGTNTQLMDNAVSENDSCDYSSHRTLRSELLNVDVQSTAFESQPVTNNEEVHCKETHKANTIINSDNIADDTKESLSFTTEPKSKGPDLSDLQTYSSMFAKTLDMYREVSSSKSDSIATKRDMAVCDVTSGTEVSKQSIFLGEKNKSDLTTGPRKSTTYEIQENKSLSSMAEQSYGCSDNSLSEGVFKYTDEMADTSRKPYHEGINKQSIDNETGIIVRCSHTEDTDFKKTNETTGAIRSVGSSSQTELPNSDDESTLKKLSEPSTANILTHRDSHSSQNKTDVQEDRQFGDKLTTDTNIPSPASNSSETTRNGSSQIAPVSITASDQQPTAKTQTTEFAFYSDGLRIQKSVGLQVGYDRDEENTQKIMDDLSTCWHREVVPEAIVSSTSSGAEVTKTETYRNKQISDTKSAISSSSRHDKTDTNDKSVVTAIYEQKVNVKLEKPAPKVEVTKEHNIVVTGTRHQERPEGVSHSVTDDLESLLNKQLNHANTTGGLRQGGEVNALFGTYYDRNTRREKRRRRQEKTLNQLSNQRELHCHFVRENDGLVKRTPSNTSQQTVFSPSDSAMHHSNRAIRPLALGRVTKLEEFLQKNEEANRNETMSNISRAVSKFSSFTSVTPSSQEEEHLTPLICQLSNGNKTVTRKQNVSDTEDKRSHEASEINTIEDVSRKSSRLRIQSSKSTPLQYNKISESQLEDINCEFATGISNTDQSPFHDRLSDCTGNNDDADVSDGGCNIFNTEDNNTAEQTQVRSYGGQIPGYNLRVETVAVSQAKDGTQHWKTAADAGSNACQIKIKTSLNSSTRIPGAVSPSNNPDKQMFTEKPHSATNIVTVQTTEECSALSTSSSSIVLSWIGSDLGDTEDMIQTTPNLTDQEDKLYSDGVAELNNYYLHAHQQNEAYEFPLVTENAQQLYDEYQSRELVRDSVSHSTPLSGINLQESEWRMPEYSSQSDNKDMSRMSYMGENVGNSTLTRFKESKETLSMHTPFASTEHTLFDIHKKEAKQTSQARLPSTGYFKCAQNDRDICSPASSKTPRQFYTFWNNNPKEYTLEQPSYFNALFRDPKWNPSFEVKEVSNKIGQHTEEAGAVGSYVQSAWTYQRVRHMSPSIVSPQRGQEFNSSVRAHSAKQQFKAHEKSATHLVSSPPAQRSNTNISFDICSIHSNTSDSQNHRYPITKTPPRNAFVIQCSEQHHKQDHQGNTDTIVYQDFSTRGITKQNTFLRKVHFDSNFKSGPAYHEPTMKPHGPSRAIVYAANENSTERLSLDKHLKTSTSAGAMPVKDRLPSDQRSRGTESSKAKPKMSLEQHLCSTFNTDRDSGPTAAQPSSENGTTQSTSSHASLNWYKPHSLPSSTSVSNGNTPQGPQETYSHSQQDISDGQERSRIPRTPHSELGTTTSSRRSNVESTRRQDTHTIEHSTIISQNLTSSSSYSTHGKANVQKSTRFIHAAQNNPLIQTLNPSLVLRTEKGSSESLSTPSSISAHCSNKYQTPGPRWYRDSGMNRAARQMLPQTPSGNTSRINGNKPARGLTNTSGQIRGGSKPSDSCEARAQANQPQASSSSNRKTQILSNTRSSHSSPSHSQKKSEINNTRTRPIESSHTQKSEINNTNTRQTESSHTQKAETINTGTRQPESSHTQKAETINTGTRQPESSHTQKSETNNTGTRQIECSHTQKSEINNASTRQTEPSHTQKSEINNASTRQIECSHTQKSEINNASTRQTEPSHVQSLKRTRGSSYSSTTNQNLEPRTGTGDLQDIKMNAAHHKPKPLLTRESEACTSEPLKLLSADPVSPFKGERRVSKLVEMFEKKIES